MSARRSWPSCRAGSMLSPRTRNQRTLARTASSRTAAAPATHPDLVFIDQTLGSGRSPAHRVNHWTLTAPARLRARSAAGAVSRLTRTEFADVIRRRRMIRAFTTEPLPEGLTGRLPAAAARAPSAGFSQGFSFLVLEGADQCAPFWRLVFAQAEQEADERM